MTDNAKQSRAEAEYFLDNLTHYKSRNNAGDRPTYFQSDLEKVQPLIATAAAAREMLAILKGDMALLSIHRSVQHMNRVRAAIAAAEAAGIKSE
jgi:hypothetical protein